MGVAKTINDWGGFYVSYNTTVCKISVHKLHKN